MKKYKFLMFILTIPIILYSIAGCQKNKYNAKIYNSAENLFLNSFLEENKVKGAYYKNPDYPDDADKKYYYDETSPACRTFIVNNPDDYSLFFAGDELGVNFDKEMVLIYIFADIYPNRNYIINNILKEGEKVKIYLELEKNNKKDATAPYQRVLIVKMEKLDISEAEFIK